MSKFRSKMIDRRDSTALIYHDVHLKHDDGRSGHLSWSLHQLIFSLIVSLLTGPYWLSDQIIAFYFQYMEFHMFKAHSKKFLFVPPSVTQLIKIGTEDVRTFLDPLKADSKDVLFFAVNDNQDSHAGGHHWSLLVFSRNEDAFFSFDSLHNFNAHATVQLVDVLKKALRCPWAEFVKVETLQQSNGYDCGIYLLANVEMVCHYYLRNGVVRHVPLMAQEVAKGKRHEILTVIRELSGNHGDAGPSYLK